MKIGKIPSYLTRLKLVQACVLGSPLLLMLLRPNNPYLLPPLGPLNNFAAPVCLVALLGCSFLLPGLILNSYAGAGKLAKWVAVLALMSAVVYALLVAYFVVVIHPPNGHPTIYATVGTTRTSFAEVNYRNTTDTQIVMMFGHRDEDLDQLWTHASLTTCRVALLFSYIFIFGLTSLCMGALAWKESRKDDLGRKGLHAASKSR
jgi:hypothetical protein